MKAFLTLFVLFIFINPSLADDRDKPAHPMLVIDSKNLTSLPRKYRQSTSSYLEKNVQEFKDNGIEIPTREGLHDLHVSASAQFSKKELEEVIKRTPGTLWVVDLREESHGYLNGKAISWYGGCNNVNEGLTLKEITKQERTLLGKLKALKTAVVYQIKSKIAYTISQANANPTPVGSIMSEAKLARLEHVKYIRFPVTDHHAPSPEMIQQFIHFYTHLPSQDYLHIHCRGGNGRSTFFMVLCDIIKNGHRLSLKEILYRQYLLGGRNMMNDLNPPSDKPVGEGVIQRLELIKSLYQQITGKPADLI